MSPSGSGGPHRCGGPGRTTTMDTMASSPDTSALEHVDFWRGPFAARTWRELGHLSLVLLLSPFFFAYVVTGLTLASGLLVTVVGGLLVLGWVVVGARGPGAVSRGLARATLRAAIATPAPRTGGRRGFWAGIRSRATDPVGWRALAHMTLELPLVLTTFVASITVLATALGALTHVVWRRYLPGVEGADGRVHHAAQIIPDVFVDTPQRELLFTVAGFLLLFVWAALTRGLAHLHRMLAAALLGPSATSRRVEVLEQTRGRAVEDADAILRRIERDLHDGTQARLVAVAMQLGEAREQLDAEGASPGVSALVGAAHDSTKDALLELRDLARGIHPPVLDTGLAPALETLAARSPLPVTLDVELDPARRPAPAVETIAYYCVTELLTNVVKHAGASRIDVHARTNPSGLVLSVRDDGSGGAMVLVPDADGHSGLAGLRDRVSTVDGDLTIESPHGGPTVVTVTLPSRPGD